jgi:hypothetical protein
MKIINIIGGIGNQMFQYAFALALQQEFPNEEIKLDISHFKGYSLHNGFEIEKNFGSRLPYATGKDLRKLTYYAPNYKLSRLLRKIFGYRKTEYKEPRLFTYWQEALERSGNCYYEGSWQNEKYFKKHDKFIREAFSFKQPLGEKNEILLKQIHNTESVSIHVRRGDYLSDPTYQGICDLPYYKNAIAFIKEKVDNPHFYIFSNDAKWCEENIAPLCKDFTIIDWNGGEKSWADMLLMSKCNHNIIAHSSFSWWAAWLNNHKDKIVVSPRGWFNSEDVTDSPQLEDWVLIENK